MQIKYGLIADHIDVTDICLTKLLSNDIITIPAGDENRALFFTDPVYGLVKQVFVVIGDNVTVCEESYIVRINIIDNTVTRINNLDIDNKLSSIQSRLQLNYGSFDEELPEQKMAVRYLTGKEKVLEIGGNIGRNTLIIASLLENNNNLVTLESDVNIARQLAENRDLNNFTFNVENSALSKRKLIQQGWDTIPSDTLIEGYNWVSTITLEELKIKYNIVFDTLVLDCEGAFYYILMDMPEILDDVNLIITENDYWDISKKNYIDNILKSKNFYVDYSEKGGWGPCCNNFFEVWKKITC